MPKYLVQARYTADGVKGLLKEGGTARVEAAKNATSSAGGTLESYYFAFGQDDVYLVVDLPDNATAAALSLAIAATGAVHTKSTVLLTPGEVDEASKKKISYQAPGK
ncbi:GYD domain-containing protein [Actinopolymorpha alba]|uniref:GYD domain-containing protein n=1 Tax=Actinopolymorpha alba TaxID=533267 RepID=UPI00037F8C2E|nr:GYD domain-containing protein [Actinopolymorpha alba]